MSSQTCISEQDLRAFVLGELPDEAVARVAEHLETCPACEAAAARLDAVSDPILESLRRAVGPSARAAPAMPETVAPPSETPRGERADKPSLIDYEVLEGLGRGGMGVVYRARDRRLDRIVALKVVKAGADAGPEVRERFQREATATASLQHPRIVQIFEVGEQDGVPFLALEFVDGGSLAQRLKGAPLAARAAAELTEGLAQAVGYAHQRGVLHRDLKPSNVLIAADGTAKVSDFGLARLLTEAVAMTRSGAIMGTPSYLSPEQADGKAGATGPGADVYALGAILYELLTGRPPFRAATVLETLAQVVRDEPVSPRRLVPGTPRDLCTICLKCLDKEPQRRYASAQDLADDLRRFLDGQPIRARPAGVAERVWRWGRRNPGRMALLASVAFLLLVIAVGASFGAVQLNQAFQRAQRAERDSQEKLFDALLAQARGSTLSRRPGQRFGSLKVLAEATRLARRLELPPERFHELRNAAILALAVPDLYPGQTWDGFPEGSAFVDFDEEMAVYVRTDERDHWQVRRMADDQLLYQRPGPAAATRDARGIPPVLSRNGRFLAVRWGEDNGLQVWKLTGTEPVRLFEEQKVAWVDYHRSGRQLVLAHYDGAVSLYDLDSGGLIRRLPLGVSDRAMMTMAVHPTEPLVAVASCLARVVQVRDLRDGAVLHTLQMPATVCHVAWHPHGHTLAVSDDNGLAIHFYERSSFREVGTLRSGGRGPVLAFNRAGDRLAGYSNWDRELQLFDLATGKLLFQTQAYVPMPYPRFSRDGRRLACEAVDGRLRIWEVGDVQAYRTLLHQGGRDPTTYVFADIGPDNRLLAVQLADSTQFWDLGTGQEVGRLLPGAHEFPHFLPGTPTVLVTGGQPGLLRWPLTPQRDNPGTLRIGPPETLARINALPTSHSRDGRVLTATAPQNRAGADAGGWVFRADRPEHPLCLLRGQNVMNIAVSPDGRWIVTLLHGGRDLQIWDAGDDRPGEEGARPIKELPSWQSFYPRFSPDGRWLTYSGPHGGLYAVGTWEMGLRFNGRGHFSPDSRLLAVETGKGVIRLIDVARGRELARLEDPQQDASNYHLFSPDGTRLVTLGKGREGGIHIWDLRTIRRELKVLDLDWDAPDYPPEPPPVQTPLRIEVVP